MIGFIKSLFGFDSVVNTTTKIIDKIAGTDWTSKEKAEFFLKYQETTKHQSPARRFIALLMVGIWGLIVLTMITSYIVGNLTGLPEVMKIAEDMNKVMKDLVVEPVNLIISFYFVTHILRSIKK